MRIPPVLLAFEGPSGVGKTTLSRLLSDQLNWPLIPEAYGRLRPPKTLTFRTASELWRIEARLIEEDCRRYAEARRLRRTDSGVILDTDFLGPLTYSWGIAARMDAKFDIVEKVRRRLIEAQARREWGLADLYVYLDAPAALVAKRAASSPADHPTGLQERHEKVGQAERILFQDRLSRLLPGRVITLRARDRPERLLERLVARLQRRGSVGVISPAQSRKVLATLGRSPMDTHRGQQL
jgi:thymidylate kinase